MRYTTVKIFGFVFSLFYFILAFTLWDIAWPLPEHSDEVVRFVYILTSLLVSTLLAIETNRG